MKTGFVIGGKFSGFAEDIYSSLKEQGYGPDFLLYCFPDAKRVSWRFNLGPFATNFLKILILFTPMWVFKMALSKWLPDTGVKTYYTKGINSKRALRIFERENPDAVIVFSCGIVGKRLCQRFQNTLLNAHAGKLPEFRGMNNVEWAYLEDALLVGTIHYIAAGVDTGDIVLEEKLNKEKHPSGIEDIREKAFKQVYDLFPEALKRIEKKNFKPVKQLSGERTTRYVMHSFLKKILEKKLH